MMKFKDIVQQTEDDVREAEAVINEGIRLLMRAERTELNATGEGLLQLAFKKLGVTEVTIDLKDLTELERDDLSMDLDEATGTARIYLTGENA